MIRAIVQFLRREDGPTAVEYAILLALIVTISIGVLSQLDREIAPVQATSASPSMSSNTPTKPAVGSTRQN